MMRDNPRANHPADAATDRRVDPAADEQTRSHGEPASARTAGAIEQTAKWTKRDMRRAAMSAMVLLTMATATGVSLGFGLEANEQRRKTELAVARLEDEKRRAEQAAADAGEERNAAVLDARNERAKANEEVQRTLAKSIIGPLQWGAPRDTLTAYEQEALWTLAELRGRPAADMVLDEVTRSPLSIDQLVCRAEVLIHAAVGLDSRARNRADAFIVRQLRGDTLSRQQKHRLKGVAFRGEVLADATTKHAAELVGGFNPSDSDAFDGPVLQTTPREWLARVALRIPAEEATTQALAQLTADAKQSPRYAGPPARLLLAAAPRLPADRAVDALFTARGAIEKGDGFAGNSQYEAMPLLARELCAATTRLPPEKAFEILCKVVPKPYSLGNDYEHTVAFQNALGVCVSRLPPRRAMELLVAAGKKDDSLKSYGRSWSEAFAATAIRLPADDPAVVHGHVTSELSGWFEGMFPDCRKCMLAGLTAAEMHRKRPGPDTAVVCEKAFQWGLGRAGTRPANGPVPHDKCMADELIGVSAGLEPTRAVEAINAAVSKLNKDYRNAEWLGVVAQVLGALAARLPPDQVEKACRPVVTALIDAVKSSSDHGELEVIARGLAAVGVGMSADQLESAITRMWEKDFCRSVDGFPAALAARLPADATEKLLLAAINGRPADSYFYSVLLDDGLPSVARVLPRDHASRVYAAVAKRIRTRMETTGFASTNGPPLRLSAVAAALPAEEGADLILDAIRSAPSDDQRGPLAEGLSAVVANWRAEEAAKRCRTAAVLLLDPARGGKKDTTDRFRFPEKLTDGVSALAARLPADEAAEVCNAYADEVTQRLNLPNPLQENPHLVGAIAAVVRYLPSERAGKLGRQLAEVTFHSLYVGGGVDSDRQLRLTHLRALLCGAPDRDLRLWQGVPAVAGPNACVSERLLEPRPLPGQQLVELLKHPFCVKEARRAVLDALEFTYHRRFADLWDFVAFAETEHPELDLLTPPKRPDRK